MASAAYTAWVNGGKPYKLCRPAAALQRALRAHGLTVYDYPDDSHLKASTPEDHTPFSATGWPVKSAYGVGHAIDIMPRADTAAGRAENAAIARALIADRNAGVPQVAWIKYLNWTDEQGNCRQERWMPSHETRSSTDKGHIHVSARSDCDDDARADGFDPLEDDVNQTDKVAGNKSRGNTIGDVFADLTNLRDWLYNGLDAPGGNPPAAGSRADLLLKAAQQTLAAKPAAVALTDEDREAISQRTAAIVIEHLTAVVFKATE